MSILDRAPRLVAAVVAILAGAAIGSGSAATGR